MTDAASELGLEQDRDEDNDTFDNLLVIPWHVLKVHNIANHCQDQNAKRRLSSSSSAYQAGAADHYGSNNV